MTSAEDGPATGNTPGDETSATAAAEDGPSTSDTACDETPATAAEEPADSSPTSPETSDDQIPPNGRRPWLPRQIGPEPVWWVREVVLAFVVAASVGAPLVGVQIYTDDQRQQHSDQLENLRFVRERSSKNADVERPFDGLDLRGQTMSGLELAKARFGLADLRGAYFTQANLTGAELYYADLRDATFIQADLGGAGLTGAKLQGTTLTGANLRGADMDKAEWDDETDFSRCYDDKTIWPAGVIPKDKPICITWPIPRN